MNDADNAPSPNRFWRKLGIRKAAMNASAESDRPKYWAKKRWRMKPVRRLQRIPNATRAEDRSTASYASPQRRRDAKNLFREISAPCAEVSPCLPVVPELEGDAEVVAAEDAHDVLQFVL